MRKLGLDIGRRSVKLVRVELSRKPEDPPRLVKSAGRDIDLGALEGDAARAVVVRAVAECAKELGVLGSEVAIAVPRGEAVLKTVILPAVSVAERAALIRFQAAKDVPFELSEVVLASGVVGEAVKPEGAPKDVGVPAALEVNYAAVRISVLEGLRSIVRDAGLKPGTLEISTQAGARAARLLAPDAEDAVLVLIGALATDIVVLKKGKLAFSRSASVGCSQTGEGADDKWLEKLVAEVQRSLRAATNDAANDSNPPTQLLLGGGGAREPNVASTLAARLGLPARILEPLGEGSSPSFLVARGLVETKPVAGIPVLDLAGIADAQAVASVKRRALLIGGCALALVVTGGGLLLRELDARENTAAGLEIKLDAMKKPVKEVQALLHEVDVAKAWELRKGRSLDVLLAATKALTKDEAYLNRFQWSEGHTVTLGGRAQDQDAVTKYVRHLGSDPIVDHVIPAGINRLEREAESKGLSFAFEVTLHDLPGEKAK
jgi:Tfp pilus assembly PilM family ATPase/Tfp pilus assembly protein PilN